MISNCAVNFSPGGNWQHRGLFIIQHSNGVNNSISLESYSMISLRDSVLKGILICNIALKEHCWCTNAFRSLRLKWTKFISQRRHGIYNFKDYSFRLWNSFESNQKRMRWKFDQIIAANWPSINAKLRSQEMQRL